MVCEVCSTDRTDDELRVLDYPRWVAAEVPCLNCGGLLSRGLPVLDCTEELLNAQLPFYGELKLDRTFVAASAIGQFNA